MGRKSKNMVNIMPLVFKGSQELVDALVSNVEEIKVTKVIQTFVMENNELEINIGKDGKSLYSGIVRWIGNRTDGTRGTVFCVEKGGRGSSEHKLVMPTEDTAQAIGFDPEKHTIKIAAKESVKCSVCGKGIKIFDEVLACPLCNSKGHSEHLVEWINMRQSCPICKKPLALDSKNYPVPIE